MESTQSVCWAYTFPDCLLASQSTRTTHRGRTQRKFRGFPYISSALTTIPLILVDSYFRVPRTRKYFCPTTLQFLSLSDSNDTTSDIPYADPSPDNRTMCWLVGAWPRFRGDLAKQISVLLALSATVHGARIEVSPKVVWDRARTRFLHPGDVWWFLVIRTLTLCARRYAHLPIPRSMRCCLRTTLLEDRTVLLPKSLPTTRY